MRTDWRRNFFVNLIIPDMNISYRHFKVGEIPAFEGIVCENLSYMAQPNCYMTNMMRIRVC